MIPEKPEKNQPVFLIVVVLILACFVALVFIDQSITKATRATPENIYEPGRLIDCSGNRFKSDDGDSFSCDGNDIRVLGIDAPEIAHPEHGIYKNQEFGQKSAQYANQMFAHAKRINALLVKKDKYDRWLSYVFVDGELFGLEMIRAGLAYESVSHYGDNGYPALSELFLNAAKDLPAPKFEPPWEWRKKNQVKNENPR